MARSLPIIVALLAACYVPAHAQDDEASGGGWFNAALGYGSARVSCDTCRSGPHLDGWTGLLGFGGTLRPHVRLGAGWEFWTNTLPDQKVRVLVTVTGSVYYYPRMWSGPFIEGELGLADYRMLKGVHDGVLFLTGDTTYAHGRGWGTTVGVGYDVRVGQSCSIRPRVAYTHGDIGTLHLGLSTRHYHRDTSAARGWQQNVLSVSVGMDLAALEASPNSSRTIPASR